MFIRIALAMYVIGSVAGLGGTTVALHAQAAPTPVAEPQYVYEVVALNSDATLLSLEKQKLATEHDTHNRFVYVKGSSEQTVFGQRSPVRLPGNAVFVIKWMQGMDSIDPGTMVALKPFVIQKGLRVLPQRSGKGVIFAGVKSQSAPDTSIPITFKKYGQSSLLISPASPLPAGEYVLVVNGGFTGVSCFGVDTGGASASPRPAATVAAAPAKPLPQVWRLKPVRRPDATSEVYEASLPGDAEANGKRGAAQLDVSCAIRRFTGGDGTQANATATLKARREMIGFPVDSLTCQGDGADGAPFLRTQLGAGSETIRNVCFDGDLGNDPKAIMSFGLNYEYPLFKSILMSPGQPLVLKLRSQEADPQQLTASFQLPDNSPAVVASFESCLKMVEEQETKAQEAIVASCPELPEKTLSKVDVLVGPAMKKLPSDPENDIGTAWDMPKATKTHPTPPKTTLVCAYKAANAGSTDVADSEKKLVPIPLTAKYCVFRDDSNTNAPYGRCNK